MVATRRTVRASTSAQRQRRLVERATPPRPKRSRSLSTASASRDAAGLPRRTRARRALLTAATEPATLRCSFSPARSSPDLETSVNPSPALRQLSPFRRIAVEPSPVPADLTQWRRGIFDRLPRLDTVPRNYADLVEFLQAVELAVQVLDRPADAFHITMQQLHPRLQAHIRACMTAQPDPTRTPYEHMVAILIQQVASGKPEDYMHQTIALIARRTDTQISSLHMQFTEAHDAYRDLCARLRSPPHLGKHFVVTAVLGNLPEDIARDTRNQASAADRLNDLQYIARLAINFDTLARIYPGRGKYRPHVVDNHYKHGSILSQARGSIGMRRGRLGGKIVWRQLRTLWTAGKAEKVDSGTVTSGVREAGLGKRLSGVSGGAGSLPLCVLFWRKKCFEEASRTLGCLGAEAASGLPGVEEDRLDVLVEDNYLKWYYESIRILRKRAYRRRISKNIEEWTQERVSRDEQEAAGKLTEGETEVVNLCEMMQ
ncbi:hypothetical protein Emag_005089 [Eimeria magna]